MDYQPLYPDWKRVTEGSWFYDWQTDEDYLAKQSEYQSQDPTGRLKCKDFRVGLALRAGIAVVEEDAIELTLTLTNQSSEILANVLCDGGCLQARSESFTGQNEVARSYLMMNERMVSMKDLSRTIDVRCTYHCRPEDYRRAPHDEGLWFWGESSDHPDSPVIVGMVSQRHDRAVVIGYAGSTSGSANADEHHCLHSRPAFGDILPGATIRRHGWILFGSNIEDLANRLSEKIQEIS
ncbi:MAG: hypothetical protein H6616_18290 [Ignavibacteria bacterium]|nr:hypothetical protein [Ignavibacteria bacterium]